MTPINTDYLAPELKEWFDKKAPVDYIKKDVLKLHAVLGGNIQPYLNINENYGHGGVLDKNKEPVKESETVLRGHVLVRPNKEILEDQIKKTKSGEILNVNEDVIFMGVMPAHFGHIMVDTMAMLWPLLQDPYKDMKIVFLQEHKGAGGFSKLIALFGIPLEKILFIHEPVSFKTVYIPEPAQYKETAFYKDRPTYVHPILNDVFKQIVANVRGEPKNPIKKVYMSRAKLKNGVPTFGEQQIENIFAKNGFCVFFPETMSFEDQIRVVRNADTLACTESSLLHHSLFMKDGSRLIVLDRSSIDGNPRQLAFNQMKNIDAVYVSASMDLFKSFSTENNFCPHLVGGTEYLKKFFMDEQFIWSEKDLAQSWHDYMDYIVDYGRCKKLDMRAELSKRLEKFEKK